MAHFFKKGDKVEVFSSSTNSYHSAKIVRISLPNIQVKYDYVLKKPGSQKRLKQYVDVMYIRPLVPKEVNRCFLVGEKVDCFYDWSWSVGKVVEILQNSKYIVQRNVGTGNGECSENSKVFGEKDVGNGNCENSKVGESLEKSEFFGETDVGGEIGEKSSFFGGETLEESSFFGENLENLSFFGENDVGGGISEILEKSHFFGENLENLSFLGEKDVGGGIGEILEKSSFLGEKDVREEIGENLEKSEFLGEKEVREEIGESLEKSSFFGEKDVGSGNEENLEKSKNVVEKDGNEENLKVDCFDIWSLRLHREWDNGTWDPPLSKSQVKSSELAEIPVKLKLKIKFSGRPVEAKFSTGTTVEVQQDREGRNGSWATAVIIDSTCHDNFVVEYHYQSDIADIQTESSRETVNAIYVRPCPPEIARLERYKQFEVVDAFGDGRWWMGDIVEVLDSDNYIVRVANKNDFLKVDHSKVRIHHEWKGDKWVVSSVNPNQQIARTETQSKTAFKPKECSPRSKRKRILDAEFSKGKVVEVESNEEGYHGSWYTAVIVDSIDNDKYMVEYQTLETEDESELLKEEANACHIRPVPPNIQRKDRFRLFERVDVWDNDGWWVGIIIRVLRDLKYTVYFWTTNEECDHDHFSLRPHQEWINGEFIADFMKPLAQLPPKPKPGKSVSENEYTPVDANLFSIGMKVEIRSGEEGYSGTWYPAIVLHPKGNGKFFVGYKTLKADDKTEILKEEIDCYYMRPSPEVTQSADPFKQFENVEAWYNDAWWHGRVCYVLEGPKYGVRIESTYEVVEFQHYELRRYEDWMVEDGQPLSGSVLSWSEDRTVELEYQDSPTSRAFGNSSFMQNSQSVASQIHPC